MLNWFKKYFIPHAGNDHRPHFLRIKNIRNVLLLLLFVELFTFLIPTLTYINNKGGMAVVLPAILADLTNEERQSQKLGTLAVNDTLNKAAEMKASDMATNGYFAHTSPDGKTPWHWLEAAGYDYQYAGENLAINFTDSRDVIDSWIASPTHKANIVKGNYTEMGTGIARGIYEGKETIFVAQVYASPIPKIVEEVKVNTVEDKTTKLPGEEEIIPTEKIAQTSDIQEITNVLGAEIDAQIEKSSVAIPTFLQKVFASPRNSTNMIFFIIFGIVILSLLLNIIIKIRHHHTDLITNGLITLIIILGVLAVNYYISNKDMLTTSSLDYSSENK